MHALSANPRRALRHLVQAVTLFVLVSPLLGYSFFRGSLISAELFGVQLTDPLAAIDFMLATQSV